MYLFIFNLFSKQSAILNTCEIAWSFYMFVSSPFLYIGVIVKNLKLSGKVDFKLKNIKDVKKWMYNILYFI